MTTPPVHDHEWFRRQALAHASGLLEDQDAAAFEAHTGSCPECRELVRQLAEDHAEGFASGSHIAAGMKVRWNVARAELRGLERAMVARHLSRCADCRADLEHLGFEPVLTEAPLTDPETGEVRDFSYAGAPGPAKHGAAPGVASALAAAVSPAVENGREKLRQGRDWLRVALGGWALAATTAAALLIARPPAPVPIASQPPDAGAPAGTGPESATPPLGTAMPTPGTPSLPGDASSPSSRVAEIPALAQLVIYDTTVRGTGDEDTAAAQVGPTTRAIALEIPFEDLPELPRATVVTISVWAPSGARVHRQRSTLGDLLGHRLLLVPLLGAELESGAYRTVFRFSGGVTVERRFRLQVEPR